MAELEEREAQAARAQLSDRESQKGPQQQHVWSNVEKTFGVTGHRSAHRTGQRPSWGLEKTRVVGQLDHAEAEVTWAE